MEKLKTTCNRDCPDACGIVADVDNGRVVKLSGDPDHPVTQGFLCYRTNRFLERQYDPDRITQPLLKQGGEFRPISWEDALERIASKLLQIREESGPAAILNYRSGGSLGVMKHLIDAFFEQFGPVAIKSGDICSGAGDHAQETDFGDEDSHDLFDLYNSRTIFVWGKNPFVSNVHLLPVLREAKKRGARLIMIDPVHHRGADFCDFAVQPRPGGDLALAAGMLKLLSESGRVDPKAEEYCDHLDALLSDVQGRSLEEWCALADVTVDEMNSLADAFAESPTAILVGWGMQRRKSGSATVRMLDALSAVTGQIGIPGGGSSFYFKRRGAFDLSFSKGLEVAPRAISEPLLGSEILSAKDPEIRFVWVTNGNPVAMLPESETVAKALRSREMTVVVDGFMTDTAECADLVLPTTTMLEDEDLVGAYGHHWIGNVQPVVPPPPGVKTDYEILQALAPRVGLNGMFGRSAREWKQQLLKRVAKQGATLEALEQGAVRNPEAEQQLFAGRRFKTATGKMNLLHSFDPEPARPTAERPLLLMAQAARKNQASQTTAAFQAGVPICTVHPSAARGFESGQRVRIESEIASLEVELAFDDRQRTDVALMDKGGWLSKGRCANLLIRARATDEGGGACYLDEPVRLLPLDL